MVIDGEDLGYACRNCEGKSHKKLQIMLSRKRSSSKSSRALSRMEVPREVRMQTQKAARMRPKVPDSPVLRDQLAVDSPKPRKRIFYGSNTPKMAELRNNKVRQKLTAELGPNFKVIKDDGFEVIAEAV